MAFSPQVKFCKEFQDFEPRVLISYLYLLLNRENIKVV